LCWQTIQTIATIVAGLARAAAPKKSTRTKRGRGVSANSAESAAAAAGEAGEAAESPGHLEGGGPTLVVCPSSAMLQWADEVQRCTTEGTVKVVAYYGAARAKTTLAELQAADIVLTTYPVLEYDFRKIVETYKVG
jgi:SNF2 family DNA or RNA helicase